MKKLFVPLLLLFSIAASAQFSIIKAPTYTHSLDSGFVAVSKDSAGYARLYHLPVSALAGTGGTSGVSAFNGRTGSVTPQASDYSSFYIVTQRFLDSLTAHRTTIDSKVDKITGKGLSTEDYTTAEKAKLAGFPDSLEEFDPANVGLQVETVADKSSVNTVNTASRFIDITGGADAGLYFFNGSTYRKFTTSTVSLFALTQGLAAYYKLDESAGNPVDATGAHNALSATNVTRSAAGILNTAYSFNGSSSYADLGAVSTSTSFTFAAWIKATTLKDALIVGVSSGSGPYLRLQANGTLGFLKASVALVGSSTGTVSAGAWTHVAFTYDNAGNYVFYINGVASGSGNNLQTFTFGNFYLGGRVNVEVFNGAIDEVGVWNRALTSADIATLYNSGTGKTYPF